ncbi:hypothetical protein [Pacificibacter sp. AS14]|uniref:hypothetical protein n=1 Tax=Alphaproteobacteria TaxID=28211 RepID=UPI00317D09B0
MSIRVNWKLSLKERAQAAFSCAVCAIIGLVGLAHAQTETGQGFAAMSLVLACGFALVAVWGAQTRRY